MNEDKFSDVVTRILSIALDMLFVGYPVRTSLGVVLGAAVWAIACFFKPSLNRLSTVVDFSQPLFAYLALGVFGVHLKTLVQLPRKATLLDESIEKTLAAIDEMKKRGIPSWQIQEMYIKLCETILKKVALNQETQQEIQKIIGT
jgi:hypothetical protein